VKKEESIPKDTWPEQRRNEKMSEAVNGPTPRKKDKGREECVRYQVCRTSFIAEAG
jgi:hypothetical protein